MQVEYRTITRPVVWKLYVSPETGSHELTREQAENVACLLSQSGQARILSGATILQKWEGGALHTTAAHTEDT